MAEAENPRNLKSGKLGVVQVAALGVSLVIVGQFTGWNFGLQVGGLGGMMVAACIVVGMYVGLSGCVLEFVGVSDQIPRVCHGAIDILSGTHADYPH